ncbi:MAG: hypothetical protein L0241_02240 [Planctomycetia bacterium]|nr:hypothetical protein [Planctomycetia bacterium]
MRADMGKVLVERPRLKVCRYSPGPEKGYRKRIDRCYKDDDSPPRREGIKRRYSNNRKYFNEHLGPLRRFLNSNVGRPWNKVYSEICQHVDRGNVVQKHILTHLFQYVAVHTILIGGEPCRGEAYARLYGEPLRTSHSYHQWYVCPKSGLLRKSKYVPRKRARVEPPRRVVLNKSQICLFIGNQWELVTVAPIPGLCSQYRAFDVILKRNVCTWGGDSIASRFYGSNVYATARRPLSRKELLALPIPIEWLP